MRKTPGSKSLHASGPAREVIISSALIPQHLSTRHNLRLGRALVLDGREQDSVSPHQAAGWEALDLQMHPSPAFPSPQAMGIGWAAETALSLPVQGDSCAS